MAATQQKQALPKTPSSLLASLVLLMLLMISGGGAMADTLAAESAPQCRWDSAGGGACDLSPAAFIAAFATPANVADPYLAAVLRSFAYEHTCNAIADAPACAAAGGCAFDAALRPPCRAALPDAAQADMARATVCPGTPAADYVLCTLAGTNRALCSASGNCTFAEGGAGCGPTALLAMDEQQSDAFSAALAAFDEGVWGSCAQARAYAAVSTACNGDGSAGDGAGGNSTAPGDSIVPGESPAPTDGGDGVTDVPTDSGGSGSNSSSNGTVLESGTGANSTIPGSGTSSGTNSTASPTNSTTTGGATNSTAPGSNTTTTSLPSSNTTSTDNTTAPPTTNGTTNGTSDSYDFGNETSLPLDENGFPIVDQWRSAPRWPSGALISRGGASAGAKRAAAVTRSAVADPVACGALGAVCAWRADDGAGGGGCRATGVALVRLAFAAGAGSAASVAAASCVAARTEEVCAGTGDTVAVDAALIAALRAGNFSALWPAAPSPSLPSTPSSGVGENPAPGGAGNATANSTGGSNATTAKGAAGGLAPVRAAAMAAGGAVALLAAAMLAA